MRGPKRRTGFANAVFDANAGTLTIDGRSAGLRPRTAAVLRCLLDRPGEVVSKDDLLREVWADLVVTENSLAQCVSEIRRELGDSNETLLKTVPRRGYSLGARVERDREPAEAPRRSRSIMVMPLANLCGDPDQDYFAEGLTDDLTTDLGRMPGFTVISRGTAQAFAGRQVDAREVGRELGVAYLVEGTVRRTEARIIVSLGLCDTLDARQMWSERFESSRTRLDALQRSMASKMSQMLHIELLAAESRSESPSNPDARDLAMRAWSLWYHATPGVSRESRSMLERSLQMDPNSAIAWAALAHSYMMDLSTRNFVDWNVAIREGEHAATRALELDPTHGTANMALAAILAFQGRHEEALACLDRQMAVNPNLAVAHQWKGIVHILMGEPRLAVAPLETAIDLSPRDRRLSTFVRNLALAHLHMGEDAKGLILAERSVQTHPAWPRSYETLAAAYAVNGLMEEAQAAVRVLLDRWPGYSIAKHREEMMSTRPAFLAQRERLLEGLIRAGLPER